MPKQKSIITKEEEKKMIGSILKLMSDLSTIKQKITQDGKKTRSEIRFIKNILKLYTLTKKNILDEQIYFPFVDVAIDTKSPPESESETESVDYNNVEFSDRSETESNYSFSQAYDGEDELVRKVMTFGFVNLLNARESKGFNIIKKKSSNYDTDIVHFKFDEEDIKNYNTTNQQSNNLQLDNTQLDNTQLDNIQTVINPTINLNDI